MAKQILLLRLEGVWQSWGERARWDIRDTRMEPTKSGVVGLLGCALGYPMRDSRLETELDAGLRFGVRVEHPGHVVQDYQTITNYLPSADGGYKYSGGTSPKSVEQLQGDPDKKHATIISPRYYLEDASFLVALEERDGFSGLLARCAQALVEPQWPVYLGRKACIPTRPIFDELTDSYDDIESALAKHQWSWLGGCLQNRENEQTHLEVIVEVDSGDSFRQDAVRTNQIRTYGFRRVHTRYVPVPTGGNT